MSDESGERAEPAQVAAMRDRLRAEQNMVLGIAGGVGGAVLGAIVWGVFTAATGWMLGLIAIVIGILVGLGVRHGGKGVSPAYGVVGIVLALAGTALGSFLGACVLAARGHGVGLLEYMTNLTPTQAWQLMAAWHGPLDALFYAIAAWEAYSLSFRRIG